MQSWPAMDSDRRSFDGTEPADPNDQQSSQSARHARSYDCSFCKRGFSNAQALGGHMNIHRKDRARLKQPYGQTLLSFQLRADEVSAPLPASYMNPPLHGGGDDGGGHVSMEPWIAPHRGTPQRRSTHALFDENPSRRPDMPWGGRGGGHEEMEGSGQDPAEAAELDLELRLGFESPDATSTGFKEFI